MKLLRTGLVFFILLSQFIASAQRKKLKTETGKTYAELSVKEGGHWEGKKYIGGTFKNIDTLTVPKSHWDHSYFIRYEGPGWESDKIGYRLYLDWRNTIDIFGKVSDTLVLKKVGVDGFESYHHMAPWGMDILKAGKGMGVGAIGRFYNNEVLHFKEVGQTKAKVENKKGLSAVTVTYKKWKTASDTIDFSTQLTIKAGERYTKHTITASKAIEGICTGIVKFKDIELIAKQETGKKWGYIATYGKQSLVPDNLGMAVFYELGTVKEQAEADYDHLLIFKPTIKPITFYFLGAWEQEKNGIKTREEFLNYLDTILQKLNKSGKL